MTLDKLGRLIANGNANKITPCPVRCPCALHVGVGGVEVWFVALLTSALVDGGECSAVLEEEPLVPTECEAGCVPEPQLTFWRIEKSFASAGN